MKALRYIPILGNILICSILLSSCDVHEFPDPLDREIQFVLNLDYDTNLPLYKVVNLTNGSRVSTEDIDIRYIVEVYPAEEENKNSGRTVLHRFTFTKEDISTLNHNIELPLKRGKYNFVVWSDYVKEDDNDLYYDTSNLDDIFLCGDTHIGSNDLRDAFRGTITSEVSDNINSATVEMRRPMAKFNFISNDVSEFVKSVQAIRAEKKEAKSENNTDNNTGIVEHEEINFSDFNIVFRYNGFMPNSFNAFSNKPSDSQLGVSFNSSINILESGEAELGFDYIFVNGTESIISVSVEVYDYDGNLLSRFKPVDVPIIRSHLTTVKANFLTSGTGGVTIIPDFDGNFNIEVN